MRHVAALAIVLALLGAALAPAQAATYYLQLGTKVARFDHLPVIEAQGTTYITLALLDELGLGATEMAEEDSAESGLAAAETGTSGWRNYRLAAHTLAVTDGAAPAVKLDGTALAARETYAYQGASYLSRAAYARAGFGLAYSALEGLYQVVGLIHQVDYSPEPPRLTVACLTPISVDWEQVDESRVTLMVEGGYLDDTTACQFAGDKCLDRIGFKSQPELGRSFIYLRQPRRTGFKVTCDPDVGYASVSFGSYFQLADFYKTSSGEIAVAVQLGAPCAVRHELLADPPRVVVDFPGVYHREATQQREVNIGSVERIRVGVPSEGTVRVVLDLSAPLDYRVLSDDDGARYYIQLLPRTPVVATAPQRRVGRTIMLDAGHGGSDPGAPGVVGNIYEAPLALAITLKLAEELSALGYNVINTRRDDRFVSLGERTDWANRELPYLFISIHCNWLEDPEFSGAMTFHHPASYQGPRLAQLIQQEMVRATGAVDKGVRKANFFVLRETVMPAALVECGFMSNRSECQRLMDSAYQRRIAQGIARGIDRFVTGG